MWWSPIEQVMPTSSTRRGMIARAAAMASSRPMSNDHRRPALSNNLHARTSTRASTWRIRRYEKVRAHRAPAAGD